MNNKVSVISTDKFQKEDVLQVCQILNTSVSKFLNVVGLTRYQLSKNQFPKSLCPLIYAFIKHPQIYRQFAKTKRKKKALSLKAYRSQTRAQQRQALKRMMERYEDYYFFKHWQSKGMKISLNAVKRKAEHETRGRPPVHKEFYQSIIRSNPAKYKSLYPILKEEIF